MEAPRRRVLVVDDSPQIRELIKVILELEGFEVQTAVDGAEAVEHVRRTAPDVMTIDVRMPRLDGFGAVELLRSDPTTADLRIVMVTACAQAADRRRGEEVGVDAYVTKPFDPAVLVAEVVRLAETARPV